MRNSRSAVDWLVGQGVEFDRRVDKEDGREFHLTREGGHSHRRVIHAADATGRAISTVLAENTLARDQRPCGLRPCSGLPAGPSLTMPAPGAAGLAKVAVNIGLAPPRST